MGPKFGAQLGNKLGSQLGPMSITKLSPNWACQMGPIYCPKFLLPGLQATKLFIVTSATNGGGYPPRFRVRFKILYRVMHPLIQHCLLHKMVYLNIIYVIATRNCEFFTTGIFSVINELLRYSTVTPCVLAK